MARQRAYSFIISGKAARLSDAAGVETGERAFCVPPAPLPRLSLRGARINSIPRHLDQIAECELILFARLPVAAFDH